MASATVGSVDSNDWPSYNRTLAGDRYSPLTSIDPSNVARLSTICSYKLPEVTSLQTGPIVIDGSMYFTTDTISYAIDAATCAEKWKQVRHSETPGALAVNRGFAYMDGRLFRGTSDAHVIALDAKDGKTLWDYQIDMKRPGVTIPMAPIAANGLVFAGNAGGDQVGVTGHVYALDAKDGHVVWRFDVVPST
ncbi:MAG TPA: PQQ-binding-like beta-propeller repeat protein, partial [Gemmatimonadaceae bacterium]|nr:PQQ-binding-like beta-propeller repeat protein [Gemmatimonadaceae bacterium]